MKFSKDPGTYIHELIAPRSYISHRVKIRNGFPGSYLLCTVQERDQDTARSNSPSSPPLQEITSKRSSETSRRGHIIANRPKNDQNHVSLTLQQWSPTTSHSLGIDQKDCNSKKYGWEFYSTLNPRSFLSITMTPRELRQTSTPPTARAKRQNRSLPLNPQEGECTPCTSEGGIPFCTFKTTSGIQAKFPSQSRFLTRQYNLLDTGTVDLLLTQK
ncbi:predicted protein [Histoplasma capsulatum var. duboisii H88]|uniref:Predicted protein n=1 Tax=Ajellomyces capsulatus (strain H88) TaxID=544711 RepID=F0U9J8_AJEC8|nr:predicted protein [Histoplasma capsulatum var. duboisii H88]